MSYRGPEVSVPKRDGTFRILLLGGSPTHGWGVNDDETIDAWMRQLLNESSDDVVFEVVNLGYDAYDSYQLYERLMYQGMSLDPDMVIVNAGVVDVGNAKFPDLVDRDPRTLFWEGALRQQRARGSQASPSLADRIKHNSYLAMGIRLARDRWNPGPEASQAALRLVEPHAEAADYFRRNLVRMASLTSEAGIPLLLSTPPSNASNHYGADRALNLSFWVGSAATTEEYRERLAQVMESVADSLASAGEMAVHVRPTMPAGEFLDGSHLTSTGNRLLAEQLIAAIPADVVRSWRRED